MKKQAAARFLLLTTVLVWSLLLNVYHMGVLPPPVVPSADAGSGEFIPRSKNGVNHLILKGAPFSRGKWAGQLTAPLLREQEDVLIAQLRQWIPHSWMLQVGIAGLITYFYGADQYIEQNDLLEMYGTGQSAPHEYDFLADGYTRQLAYHGLHEVGQMMVDSSGETMGCTVAAVPHDQGWILGRNFDFEGGRIFDREKIVKWVFPDRGFNHVSVIWAGMVGAVTGINDQGLYISLNAAGSQGFRRIGTPTTLVVYKVLREAATVDQAIAILREADTFITDVFVVMDKKGRLVRVEKSPQKMDVIEADKRGLVVANHLVGKTFEYDETNEKRKIELTSTARESRGLALISAIPQTLNAQQKINKVLAVLRDKGMDEREHPLHLGHHAAIDSMIATHSVIVARGLLFVSQGPSLAGPFLGFDLAQSFKAQKPVPVDALPADPLVSEQFYADFKAAAHNIAAAASLRRRNKCDLALNVLHSIPEPLTNQGPYFHALGDVYACLHESASARAAWQQALNLQPAYAHWRRDLESKLEKNRETQ